jgi:hypothetical protein
VPKQSVLAPTVPSGRREKRVTNELIRTASQGKTIPLLDLPGGRTLPDTELSRVLTAVDSNVSPDVPLLSALVTGQDGGPVPFFRQILKGVGLAVPHSDEVLLMIWRREQERAHAAHANPPRPLPPRLVPAAQKAQQSGPRPT